MFVAAGGVSVGTATDGASCIGITSVSWDDSSKLGKGCVVATVFCARSVCTLVADGVTEVVVEGDVLVTAFEDIMFVLATTLFV